MSVKTFECRTSHVITTIQNLYMIKSLFTLTTVPLFDAKSQIKNHLHGIKIQGHSVVVI